jgi:hypothetical protein
MEQIMKLRELVKAATDAHYRVINDRSDEREIIGVAMSGFIDAAIALLDECQKIDYQDLAERYAIVNDLHLHEVSTITAITDAVTNLQQSLERAHNDKIALEEQISKLSGDGGF